MTQLRLTLPRRALPPAWTLPKGHEDLCPAENEPVAVRAPYNAAWCPTCQRHTTATTANTPGGGRLDRHYRADVTGEAR